MKKIILSLIFFSTSAFLSCSDLGSMYSALRGNSLILTALPSILSAGLYVGGATYIYYACKQTTPWQKVLKQYLSQTPFIASSSVMLAGATHLFNWPTLSDTHLSKLLTIAVCSAVACSTGAYHMIKNSDVDMDALKKKIGGYHVADNKLRIYYNHISFCLAFSHICMPLSSLALSLYILKKRLNLSCA